MEIEHGEDDNEHEERKKAPGGESESKLENDLMCDCELEFDVKNCAVYNNLLTSMIQVRHTVYAVDSTAFEPPRMGPHGQLWHWNKEGRVRRKWAAWFWSLSKWSLWAMVIGESARRA